MKVALFAHLAFAGGLLHALPIIFVSRSLLKEFGSCSSMTACVSTFLPVNMQQN